MIVSINQPAYLPWLGYFDRIARSDLHVVLDDVQMERHSGTSFTNRNRIRTPQGWTWLTVPVRHAATPEEARIVNVQVDGERWAAKHWRSIEQSYGRASHFEPHREFFERMYARAWPRLAPLLREATDYLLRALDLATPLRYSSELQVASRKSDLVLDICRAVGATRYLSGPLGRDYLDAPAFAAAGIEVLYHDYSHPTYAQRHGDFVSNLSVIDLLFNHGPASLGILRGDAR